MGRPWFNPNNTPPAINLAHMEGFLLFTRIVSFGDSEMKITYRVHRVSAMPSTVSVTLPTGEEIPATVAGVDVELVPVSHEAAGTVKLHYVGAEAEAASAKFTEGNEVNVDWASV